MTDKTIHEILYNESLKKAKFKAWVFSDLQQRDPKNAESCLKICTSDFIESGLSADVMWYLGDAVEGKELDHLSKMSVMQEKAFYKIGIPLCFVMGNHDMEYTNSIKETDIPPTLPFWETVKKHPGWTTTEHCSDWYFKRAYGDLTVFFLGDHVAEDQSWRVFHQNLPDPSEKYPLEDRIAQLKAEIEAEKGPVITASHYPYPGGNRPSALLEKLLPLPDNVVLHLYGHAHIGDFKWAKENAYRRISGVDWHDIPQIDVSSFENIRGDVCRSVFLHVYEDNSMGLFFRDHDHRCFTECYFPSARKYPSFL